MQALTPNALAEHFDTSRQAVSKHIRVLTECGLVNQKQVGREIYYQCDPTRMKEIDTWLDTFRGLWETRFAQLDVVLSTKKQDKQ